MNKPANQELIVLFEYLACLGSPDSPDCIMDGIQVKISVTQQFLDVYCDEFSMSPERVAGIVRNMIIINALPYITNQEEDLFQRVIEHARSGGNNNSQLADPSPSSEESHESDKGSRTHNIPGVEDL